MSLLLEQKNHIISLAHEFCAKHNMTQADLARLTGINQGYLSNMMRNQFSIESNGTETSIADKYFASLSAALGFSLKKQYWLNVETEEFIKTIYELNVAKRDSKVATIINATGYGKTYTIDRFINVNPMHTYKITVNSMYKVRDIIHDLCECLGTPIKYNAIDSLRGITVRLKQLKMNGHNPLVIIDEAENLRLPVIQMLKGLYDNIIGYASIALIGTPQLLDMLERMNRSDKAGAPQFYRRIKAGIKVIDSVKNFAPFYEKMKVTDKGLQKLLNGICNNYGELHDYLEPAIKEADEQNVPLTEQLFRLMYNMPKH